MQMSYLYASEFPFKIFRKLAAQHAEAWIIEETGLETIGHV